MGERRKGEIGKRGEDFFVPPSPRPSVPCPTFCMTLSHSMKKELAL